MRLQNTFIKMLAIVPIASMVLAPTLASAQRYSRDHRENKKNEWRNFTIGSAAVAAAGLITKNKTLTIAGLAGAVYSGYRLSEEEKHSRRYSRYDGYDRHRSSRYDGYDRVDWQSRRDRRSCGR